METGLVSLGRSGGTHTSRTILLRELTALLDTVPAEGAPDDYRHAVIDLNVLGKKTLNSRQRTYRYLRELYALDCDVVVFRALRDLWHADQPSRRLLAILCALARDPALRATAPLIMALPHGAAVTPGDLARAVMDRYPGAYTWAVAHKVGRNAASSWTQSGHLVAGDRCKRRATAIGGPGAVAYALLLGHLEGVEGEALLKTFWTEVLDMPPTVVLERAMVASQRGWIELRHAGGVTDVSFRFLLRDSGSLTMA